MSTEMINITFNKKRVKDLKTSAKLSHSQIGRIIQVDKEHFDEKDNWYIVDGFLSYFKARPDTRIIGELLSDTILRMRGFETATYKVCKKGNDYGLISKNIRKEGIRYESLSTLNRLFPSFNTRKYIDGNEITLFSLLQFIETVEPDPSEIEEKIIRKYVIDWFTDQIDFNVRNMVFQQDQNGKLDLAPLIDNEASFGATKKGIDVSTPKRLWIPAIPYTDLDFKEAPYDFEGRDANIVYLMMDYPDQTAKILKELTDYNYYAVINSYKFQPEGLQVPIQIVNYLNQFVYLKQEEGQAILDMFKKA